MIWRCPKCALPLAESERSLVCEANHRYDRARQGYSYLLLANQKNSRNPGDNEEMIAARKYFLRAGYYQPLITEINQKVEALLAERNTYAALNILDLGCGEGFYLETFTQSLVNAFPHILFNSFGVDISKEAVRKAAVSAKTLSNNIKTKPLNFDYAVASNYHLPVNEQSVDLALNVFAPIAVSEMVRVLKKGGIFIRVQPAERHLYQLKECLYGEVKLHELHEIESEFTLLNRESLKFTLELKSSESIANLLAMTPLNWHGKTEAKTELIEKGELSLEAHFDIQVLSV